MHVSVPMNRCAAVVALLAGHLVPPSAPAQEATTATAQTIRQAIARRTGVWITSNAEYSTAENGEPAVYGTHFVAGLGGVSMTGCLWGENNGEVTGVYWHFFTGWDPTSEALIVYQSNQQGVVGMGREKLQPSDGPDAVDQTFIPLPGRRRPPYRIRHETIWVAADTMRNQTYERVNGKWEPRRTYLWIREADHPTPC